MLSSTITKLGGSPVMAKKPADYNFPVNTLKSQADVQRFAAELEKGAASAYLGAVPAFGNKDLAKAAASILGDETMHWAVLRNAGRKPGAGGLHLLMTREAGHRSMSGAPPSLPVLEKAEMRPPLAPRLRSELARVLAMIWVATGIGCAAPASSAGSRVGAVVTIADDFRFEPAAVTVHAGHAVEWRNASHFVHSVTDDPELAGQPADALLPAGANAFNSGELHPGNRYRRVLPVPGSYRYFCIPHEGMGMLGRITVLPP